MKSILLFITAVILGILVSLLFSKLQTHPQLHDRGVVTNTTSQFSLQNAPKNSLRGTISSFSGDVLWQSRTATQGAKLTNTRTIQQGESLMTKNGTVTTTFPNSETIAISKNSEVDIIQTVPQNMVFSQPNGTATYGKLGTMPVSVVGLDLLINQNSGQMKVTVDTNQKEVIVEIISGSAKVAYEDLQNTSNVTTISETQTFVFDDTTKTGNIK